MAILLVSVLNDISTIELINLDILFFETEMFLTIKYEIHTWHFIRDQNEF